MDYAKAEEVSLHPTIAPDVIESERKRLAPEIFASQYQGQFAGIDIYPCDRCGGPREGAMCVVWVSGEEEPLKCPDCGKLVGEDGLTRVALVNGRCHATIIATEYVPERVDPPEGVTRVLRLEDTPVNIEPLDDLGADRLIVLHPPVDDPEELPPGVD